MPDKLLTIYIMCCHHPEPVARSLDSLLPFDGKRTEIIVADNSVDDAIEKVVADRKDRFHGNLRYIRNVCNLGGLANLMRSFEVARGDYLWLNGCNDKFSEGAVRKAEELVASKNASFFAFPVDGLSPNPFPSEETVFTSFVDALHALKLGTLASTNVTIYDLEYARGYLPVAYEAMSNLIPHVSIMAAGINAEHPMCFIPVRLVERVPRERRRWDPRKLVQNLSLIYPDPASRQEWKQVRPELFQWLKKWVQSFEGEDFRFTSELAAKLLAQFGIRALPLSWRIFLRVQKRRLAQMFGRVDTVEQDHPERFM